MEISTKFTASKNGHPFFSLAASLLGTLSLEAKRNNTKSSVAAAKDTVRCTLAVVQREVANVQPVLLVEGLVGASTASV